MRSRVTLEYTNKNRMSCRSTKSAPMDIVHVDVLVGGSRLLKIAFIKVLFRSNILNPNSKSNQNRTTIILSERVKLDQTVDNENNESNCRYRNHEIITLPFPCFVFKS